jgi:hypothetical protein
MVKNYVIVAERIPIGSIGRNGADLDDPLHGGTASVARRQFPRLSPVVFAWAHLAHPAFPPHSEIYSAPYQREVVRQSMQGPSEENLLVHETAWEILQKFV